MTRGVPDDFNIPVSLKNETEGQQSKIKVSGTMKFIETATAQYKAVINGVFFEPHFATAVLFPAVTCPKACIMWNGIFLYPY